MSFAKIKGVDYIYPLEDSRYETVMDNLPPGMYEPEKINGLFSSIVKYRIIPKGEDLVTFEQGIIREIVNKVDNFFKKETIDAYKELKIGHKIGMILYGPHGTGKTCAALLAMHRLIEKRDAICLNCTGMKPWDVHYFSKEIRNGHKNPIVIFIDEADDSFSSYEEAWLPILDGHESTYGVVIIGCTNKLSEIADRIKDRKSRIKYLFEVDNLPIAVYETYISKKLTNVDKGTIAKFAYLAESERLSIDELKHAVIDYHLEGISVEEAIKVSKKSSKKSMINKEGDLEHD